MINGKKITVIGGGNIGMQFAAHAAAKGYPVTLYTSKCKDFQKNITVYSENDEIVVSGKLEAITDDPCIAFDDADIVFVTYPAFMFDDISALLSDHLKSGSMIFVIPGTGGAEFAFNKCILKGCTLAGLQRVPSVARIREKGKSVNCIGYRNQLHVSTIPCKYADKARELISDMFEKDTVIIRDYLNITLTPSNPILHTSRLYCLFRDYQEGKTYDSVPLFYEEWDLKSAELLLACDDEVQAIRRALKDFDLSYVKSLKEHYEIDTPAKLVEKIHSIDGFKGLKSPVIEVNGKFIPDLKSRYFTADFPYGLSILIQIGHLVQVCMPNMEMVNDWYMSYMHCNSVFEMRNYGICTYYDFKCIYE